MGICNKIPTDSNPLEILDVRMRTVHQNAAQDHSHQWTVMLTSPARDFRLKPSVLQARLHHQLGYLCGLSGSQMASVSHEVQIATATVRSIGKHCLNVGYRSTGNLNLEWLDLLILTVWTMNFCTLRRFSKKQVNVATFMACMTAASQDLHVFFHFIHFTLAARTSGGQLKFRQLWVICCLTLSHDQRKDMGKILH